MSVVPRKYFTVYALVALPAAVTWKSSAPLPSFWMEMPKVIVPPGVEEPVLIWPEPVRL